jgi:MFS family permease
VFRNRLLAALLAAELISTTGIQMTFVALPWFVLVTTGSLAKMSYVLAAEIAPIALFGIPSGSVVGRLGARRTMLASDALRAPLMLLVPVLHRTGHLSFGLLVGLVFVLGLFAAPYYAAQRTIVPELFGDDERVVSQASAIFGGVTHATMVIGPALGGVLVAAFSPSTVLVIDGATYVVAFVLVLALVRAGARLPQDDSSRGLLAGVRYLARDRLLGPATLTVIVLDGSLGALFLAMPALVYLRYDRDPRILGWLFSAFGVGAVAGSVAAMKALERVPPLRLAVASLFAALVPVWALVVSMPWWGVALAFTVLGGALPFVNAPAIGILTTRPPVALRAKVMTAVMTASALGGPVGRVVVGPLFEGWGIPRTIAAIAATVSLGAVLFALAVAWSGELGAPPAAPLESGA